MSMQPGAWFLLFLLTLPLGGMAEQLPASGLDHGFHLMYDLDFAGAQTEFGRWQADHPQDPVGPVAEAAALLFSELYRLGILDAQFFESDAAFAATQRLSPDATVRTHFDDALRRAEALARDRLARSPNDSDALFALALSSGLQADYASLIEKRNLRALVYTRQANQWAEKLVAVDPLRYDIYLATGISKYLIGSLSAPMRWLLRLGGYKGSRQGGIADVEVTAEHGQYLRPFARILLAIAYLREKQTDRARQVLTSLRDEFPQNPLFARELARLDARKSCRNC